MGLNKKTNNKSKYTREAVSKKEEKFVEKKVVVKVVKKEKICQTCIQRNRKQKIIGNICLTCKQGNRKQNLV